MRLPRCARNDEDDYRNDEDDYRNDEDDYHNDGMIIESVITLVEQGRFAVT